MYDFYPVVRRQSLLLGLSEVFEPEEDMYPVPKTLVLVRDKLGYSESVQRGPGAGKANTPLAP